jgi:hypothetical protein
MATLITIAQLKQNSLIHGNVETDRLTVILNRCQEMYLKPIVGNDFYNHITTTNSPTAAEVILIEQYIRPFLICSTEIMAAKHFNWEIRNKSVGRSNDQYQQANEWDSVDKLANDYTKQAQFYKSEMVQFINENSDDFPLITKCLKKGTSHDKIHGFINRRYGSIR